MIVHQPSFINICMYHSFNLYMLLGLRFSYSVRGTPFVKAFATVVAMGPGLVADVDRLEDERCDAKVYLDDNVPAARAFKALTRRAISIPEV